MVLAGCAAKRAQYDVPTILLPDQYNSPSVSFVSGSASHPDEPSAALSAVGSAALPVEQVVSAGKATSMDNVLSEWWRLMGSHELDGLVDRALANNSDLRIAAYRIVQAKARAGQASADRGPEVTIPVSVSNEAPYSGVGTVQPGGNTTSKKTYKASLRGDWRMDIWGERQSIYEASELQLWNATFQRDDVQRNLVANTVSTYVEYLSLNDRLRVYRETEVVLSGMVDSSRQRMEKGDATIIDLEQMQTAVYAVRAVIPLVELQRETTLNYIAWLVGAVPGTLHLSDKGLDSLSYPAVLPGMPSSLLLRRPDVRSIEAQLLANDANVDVARTRVLPTFDLSAQVGYGSLTFSQWFQPHNLFWSAIASLSATIFDSGKQSREVDYAKAVHEELVEAYVRTVYDAVREVEDSLMNVKLMNVRLKAQQQSVDAARRAWEFSTESYSAGAIDYLVLVDTQRTYHSKLDDLHQVAMKRFQGLTQLFSALGGGVRQGEAIPGDGLRPLSPLGNSAVLASVLQPLSLEGVDFENATLKDRENEDIWLSELPAVSDMDAIGATLRDLRNRFPSLMTGRILLPRQLGKIENNDNEDVRAAWYRLFIGQFDTSEAAEAFCAGLKAKQMRCRAVTSRSSEFREGTSAPRIEDHTVISASKMAVAAAPVLIAPPASIQPALQPPSRTTEFSTEGAQLSVEPAQAVMSEKPSPDSSETVLQPAAVNTDSSEAQVVQQASPVAQATQVHYAVQLDSFAVPELADTALAVWRKRGYPAYVYKPSASNGRTWHTVRVGHFYQREDAKARAAEIREKWRVSAMSVPIQVYDIGPYAVGIMKQSGK